MRWYYVFLLAFGAALAAQSWIWSVDTLTDEGVWLRRLDHLAQDTAAGQWQQYHYSAHPGLAPLWVALALEQAGMAPAPALEASVALWVSVMAGFFAVVLERLLPGSPAAWVGVGLTALHPLYVSSSLANAVAGPAAALGLLALLAYTSQPKPQLLWLMGGAFGLSLLTHFSVSLLVAAPALGWLFFQQGWKPGLLALGVAVAIFTAGNPLVVQHPLEHFRFNFHYITLHTTTLGVVRLGVEDIGLLSPWALLGIFAMVGSLVSSWLPTLFPRRTQLFLIGLTVAVSGALLYAQTQSVRYFFSLILFWEIMGALWLFRFSRHWSQPQVVSIGLGGVVVAGQAILLIQGLY